jgi:hypothetical protein
MQPYLSTAWAAYSEQVGVYLHALRHKRLDICWYIPLIKNTTARLGISLMFADQSRRTGA